MKKRHAHPGTRVTGNPTVTQRGIDVDAFIRKNRRLIERLRKGTR